MTLILNGQARNEELARAAEEQREGNSSASTSGSTNGSGGNGGLSSATRANSADVVAYMEDYDKSIPNLNNVCIRCLLNSYEIMRSNLWQSIIKLVDCFHLRELFGYMLHVVSEKMAYCLASRRRTDVFVGCM